MTPLVSILIPAYNAEASIAETLSSALSQTWSRKEIIVVDDESHDHTLCIARRFSSKNVLIATQENAGAAAARNHAFTLCQGDFIQWLDADDLLAPDKISKQLEALQTEGTNRTLTSSAWAYFRTRLSQADFRPTLLWDDLSPTEWLLRKLENNIFMQTATWLVTRELTEAAGSWDTRLLSDDDGEYFSRVMMGCDRILFVPEAKMYYRRTGPNSLSYIGQSNKKLEAHLLSMQLHIQYLRALEESPRVRVACLEFLQQSLLYFYPERPDLVTDCQQLAASLGGILEPPKLSWKYEWIRALFGWTAAKRTQLFYNHHKSVLLRELDKFAWQLSSRCAPSDSRPLPSRPTNTNAG